MTDTFHEIIAEYNEPPAIYAAVLAALQHGNGETTNTIGRRAWTQLDHTQQAEALPCLLESYTTRVACEEADKAAYAALDAIDDSESVLEDSDLAAAWDAVATHSDTAPDESEIVLERDVLIRLLDEIARLNRRADAEPAHD